GSAGGVSAASRRGLRPEDASASGAAGTSGVSFAGSSSRVEGAAGKSSASDSDSAAGAFGVSTASRRGLRPSAQATLVSRTRAMRRANNRFIGRSPFIRPSYGARAVFSAFFGHGGERRGAQGRRSFPHS